MALNIVILEHVSHALECDFCCLLKVSEVKLVITVGLLYPPDSLSPVLLGTEG
jgi:hypothetical protein